MNDKFSQALLLSSAFTYRYRILVLAIKFAILASISHPGMLSFRLLSTEMHPVYEICFPLS